MDQHLLWLGLLSLRFLWALLPQYGYIFPDEFFQTVEVVAGDTFNTEVERTWEFNSSFPLRSILIPKLLFQPAFQLLQIASSNVPFISLSAHSVLCTSRFVMTTLSLIVDLCVFSISSDICLNKGTALTLLSSSYVVLVFLTHSFSNSIEAVLLSLIYLVIVKSMKNDKRFFQENEFQRKNVKKSEIPVLIRVRKNSNTSSDDDSDYEDNKDNDDVLSDSYGLLRQLHSSAFDLRKRKRTQSDDDSSANTGTIHSDTLYDNMQTENMPMHSERGSNEDNSLKNDSESNKAVSAYDFLENHKHFRPYYSNSIDMVKSNNESVKICILLAVINTAGFFNRPTFILFTVTPFLWWFIQFCKYRYLVFVRITTFILASILTALLFSVTDTVYYNNLTWVEVLNLEKLKSDFVIAPLNFFLYNADVENLEKHGRHPFYLHFLVNIPLLFGPLVIFIYADIKNIFYDFLQIICNSDKEKRLNKVLNLSNIILTTILSPVFLLSVFPHQEPRFIIPILFPVVIYIALTRQTLLKKFYAIYFLFNFILAILYGVLHQGGVVPCLMKLHSLTQEQNSPSTHNIIFSHTYMPPKHLLFIDKSSSRVNVYDMKGTSFDKVYNSIFEIRMSELSSGPLVSSHMYIVFPWNVLLDFKKKYSGKLKLKMVDKFFPHLSLDDPPLIRLKDSYATVKNKLSLFLMEIESK